MRIITLIACLWATTNTLDAKIVFCHFQEGNWRNWEIYTMGSDGNNQTRLTFNESNDFSPAWSPDGQQIAFDGGQDGNREVYVIDADGQNQRRLTYHPASDSSPSWSPDGSQIAFDSNRDVKKGKREVYVMDADGSNVKQVTDFGIASNPKWSPDGKWILFTGTRNNREQIYAIRSDGTKLWQVAKSRPHGMMFLGGWSPDGKQVLYTETINFDFMNASPVIATLDPKGRARVIRRKPIQIPRMTFDFASLSADGQSILFIGQKAGIWNIYRFGLINKKLVRLTQNLTEDVSAEDAYPQEWNPSLSVPKQQDLLVQTWGRIKAGATSK